MSDKDLHFLKDFPKVSTKQWKEKIVADLKGADFDKKLVWKTNEGFSVQPFYRSEDLKELRTTTSAPGQFPYVRGTKESNCWAIRQNIVVSSTREARKANAKALDLLNKGITSLGFCVKVDKINYNFVKNLLADIKVDAIALNFDVCLSQAVELAGCLSRYFKRSGYDTKKIVGSINVDPIKNMLVCGKKLSEQEITEKLVAAVKALKSFPNFHAVGVNSVLLNNAGVYCVTELANALAWGVEYLTLLTEAGIPAHVAAKSIRFNMGIGVNYFMEIAKFRAARLLWAKIVEAYKNPTFTSALKEASKLYISAQTSKFNVTIFDAYVNLLRSQTETMSAAIAGVDEVTTLPFDIAFENPTDFAERIARNQQLLLKEEAHFDKIVDPSAGSYYIETLTNAIAENAWKEFLAIQDKGGIYQYVVSGQLQDAVEANLKARLEGIAKRKEVLLGSNQFPNFTEKAAKKIKKTESCCCGACTEGKPEIKPLPCARATQEFEALRLTTENAKKQPVAFMLTIGNLAMRIARAQFSCNFLACAGYKVIDNNGFKTVSDGINAAKKAKADLLVLCSSDDEYATLAPEAFDLLKKDKEFNPIFIVAGAPACMEDLQKAGIQNFIHVRCNVLETLQSFNKQLLK